MMTDIEIAQGANMLPIEEIAEKVGLSRKEISLYGDYKAKIDLNKIKDLPDKKGKLILVTAISPTPAGEGKTISAVMGRIVQFVNNRFINHSVSKEFPQTVINSRPETELE